jgi:hypothetical protein
MKLGTYKEVNCIWLTGLEAEHLGPVTALVLPLVCDWVTTWGIHDVRSMREGQATGEKGSQEPAGLNLALSQQHSLRGTNCGPLRTSEGTAPMASPSPKFHLLKVSLPPNGYTGPHASITEPLGGKPHPNQRSVA